MIIDFIHDLMIFLLYGAGILFALFLGSVAFIALIRIWRDK